MSEGFLPEFAVDSRVREVSLLLCNVFLYHMMCTAGVCAHMEIPSFADFQSESRPLCEDSSPIYVPPRPDVLWFVVRVENERACVRPFGATFADIAYLDYHRGGSFSRMCCQQRQQ